MFNSADFFQILQVAPVGGSPQALTTLVMFGLIFVIFYFLIIRPQNKRQKETKRMLEKLKKGDKIQTIGGIRGSIVTVKDESVIVKVDDSCNMEFIRSAIASVVKPAEDSPKKPKTSSGELDAPEEKSEPVKKTRQRNRKLQEASKVKQDNES